MCAQHNDCGGVTKIQSGEYECRTRIFIEREGEVSFQKPVNFPVPIFTEEMIDSGKKPMWGSQIVRLITLWAFINLILI